MHDTIIWGPGLSGPVYFAQLVLVLISVARLAGSANRLYRWRMRISLEGVIKGAVDSDNLAAIGLANQLPYRALLKKRMEISKHVAATGTLPHTLGRAETRFWYFVGRYQANVDSARRAAVLVFLLSLVMLAYSAYPRYFMYFNDSNRPGSSAAFFAVEDLLTLLGHGWLFCAVLLLASSFIERALAKRKLSWTYFCACLRSEFSRHA